MISRESVDAAINARLHKPLVEQDPATPIREAIIDSFAYVELALELEDNFGLRLSDSKIQEIATLGDLSKAIDACLADGRGITARCG